MVSGRLAGAGEVGVLLAHGAGSDQDHPFIASLRSGLAGAGLTVVTFNYPYVERGSRRPDRQETLVACHRAAAGWLQGRVRRLFLAGRSMGGRIATHVVAGGVPAAGVVLYSYPLHPAGKPDRLRVSHLEGIEVPMLFFQGTRDALSRMDLFDIHIRPLPTATVVLLEGAGHSFGGGGWTLQTMAERLVAGTVPWVTALSGGTGQS